MKLIEISLNDIWQYLNWYYIVENIDNLFVGRKLFKIFISVELMTHKTTKLIDYQFVTLFYILKKSFNFIQYILSNFHSNAMLFIKIFFC